jgi:hypothetical protein
MSQFNQPSFNPTNETEKKEEKKEKIKVRLSIFFDGTLNNRVNIDHRIAYEKKTKTGEGIDEVYQKYDGKDKDNSYEGDYTNIAIMERLIKESNGYEVTLAVYTEGPGTEDHEDDSALGYALGIRGVRDTGVRAKVERGIQKAVSKINKKVPGKENIIDLLTIDVFGFSRGAAGARNCIHEVLDTGKKPIKERLVEKGYNLNKVEVSFAGLYDTVSAHGWGVVFDRSDVSTLKLNAVANAKKVVQLAAADEHRKNFSLTDIMSVGKNKGIQLFLPGVHSDIGGGYRAPVAGKPSENQLIYRSFFPKDVEHEKQRLIEEGWYREDEITILQYPSAQPSGLDECVIKVEREQVGNDYRKIPFNLMAEHAKKSGINFKTEISDEVVPDTLTAVDGRIRQYIGKVGSQSKAEDWAHNAPWLVTLRHEQLHFSARYAIGHGPRFNGGKRIRKVYRG